MNSSTNLYLKTATLERSSPLKLSILSKPLCSSRSSLSRLETVSSGIVSILLVEHWFRFLLGSDWTRALFSSWSLRLSWEWLTSALFTKLFVTEIKANVNLIFLEPGCSLMQPTSLHYKKKKEVREDTHKKSVFLWSDH